MKKIMILIVMLSMTIAASAQRKAGVWSITPKVGMNLANLAGDVSNNSIKVGLVAGVDGMYQATPLIGVSAGVFYSMQGCSGDGDLKLNYNFINIPVLANFYITPDFALKIGLQPAFVASAKQKADKNEYDVKDAMQSIDLSVPIGASYQISDFVIDARYNLGVTKINKNGGSIRNSVFQITVGYVLPL